MALLPYCDISVIILCFIYVHNAISDAHIIYGSTTLATNELTDLIMEITGPTYLCDCEGTYCLLLDSNG